MCLPRYFETVPAAVFILFETTRSEGHARSSHLLSHSPLSLVGDVMGNPTVQLRHVDVIDNTNTRRANSCYRNPLRQGGLDCINALTGRQALRRHSAKQHCQKNDAIWAGYSLIMRHKQSAHISRFCYLRIKKNGVGGACSTYR
jgi:hypothetical protein